MGTRDEVARRRLRLPEAFVELGPALCDGPLHAAFERQAVWRPDDVAIRSPRGNLTYAVLDAAANRAAHTLLARARASQPVAVLLDQGRESIVWTLAILKAGMSYAPLDQRLPAAVLRTIVDRLEPGAMIAGATHLAACRALAAGSLPVIVAEAIAESVSSGPRPASDSPGLEIDADDVACIFHTSGSTGTPKGVADSHRNVLANVRRYVNSLGFAPGDTLSLVQNPSFSGTMSSTFGALASGAALAPLALDREGLLTMSGWVKTSRVTVFHSVPAIFRRLTDSGERFPDIRLVRLEGDRATAADVAHFDAQFRQGCTLVNGLGATECGLARQFFVARGGAPLPAGALPVGYEVDGVEVRIVDPHGTPLPAGSLGEIEVEGRHLALGYWRDPELNAQRFSVTPGGTRRYRTGDLGRRDEDGSLTIRDRSDRRHRLLP